MQAILATAIRVCAYQPKSFLFFPRCFLSGVTTGSSIPNTASSDVRFLALIDLLQFLADPFPEFAHFLCGFALRLKFGDSKAAALRVLIRIANDDEVGANHAQHGEPLFRLAIAIAARWRLGQNESRILS